MEENENMEEEMHKHDFPIEEKEVKSLGTVQSQEQRTQVLVESQVDKNLDTIGWKPIPHKDIPSEWKYNTREESLKIKSASFEQMKHYASMNEDDPNSVDERINEILFQNCKVGINGDYRDLTITDKLHTFFMIRDYTLMNHEAKNNIFMEFTSQKGEKKKIKMDSKVFEYFDIPKGVAKWYDESLRCFVVKDDEMKRPIKAYVPKVGVIEHMKSYITHMTSLKKQGENVYLDKEFITYAQYMISDWRGLDDDFKRVEELKKAWDSMSVEEVQIFDYLVNHIKAGIKPTIKVKFDAGNVEVFPITFRRYKSLFYISNKISRLFEAE